jgi:translation initiation factor IF-1
MERFVTAVATIVGPFSDIYEAALPNGKRTLAHLCRKSRHLSEILQPGAKVLVEMTTYDFDTARIVELVSMAPESAATEGESSRGQ